MPIFTNPLFRRILYIAVATLGVIALLYGAYRWSYHRGVVATNASWNHRIAKEGVKNAKTSDTLATGATALGAKLTKDTIARARVITVIKDRIAAQTAALPETDCRVPDRVMDDRNAIRADPRLPE